MKQIYKVYFVRGEPRLIPANFKNFELIPQNVIKDTKKILKAESKKNGKASVREVLG